MTRTVQPDIERAAALVLAGNREHLTVSIPGSEAIGKMRLLTRSESLTVKAEALAAFRTRGLLNEDGAVVTAALDDWRCELAARHLAIAVRQIDAPDLALAPLEAWRDLTDEEISGPWDRYQDLRDRWDPLGDDARALTADEVTMLRAASKKKDVVVLRSFGLHKLALFLTTTADPPAS